MVSNDVNEHDHGGSKVKLISSKTQIRKQNQRKDLLQIFTSNLFSFKLTDRKWLEEETASNIHKLRLFLRSR